MRPTSFLKSLCVGMVLALICMHTAARPVFAQDWNEISNYDENTSNTDQYYSDWSDWESAPQEPLISPGEDAFTTSIDIPEIYIPANDTGWQYIPAYQYQYQYYAPSASDYQIYDFTPPPPAPAQAPQQQQVEQTMPYPSVFPYGYTSPGQINSDTGGSYFTVVHGAVSAVADTFADVWGNTLDTVSNFFGVGQGLTQASAMTDDERFSSGNITSCQGVPSCIFEGDAGYETLVAKGDVQCQNDAACQNRYDYCVVAKYEAERIQQNDQNKGIQTQEPGSTQNELDQISNDSRCLLGY